MNEKGISSGQIYFFRGGAKLGVPIRDWVNVAINEYQSLCPKTFPKKLPKNKLSK
jgi:hypothetical protein